MSDYNLLESPPIVRYIIKPNKRYVSCICPKCKNQEGRILKFIRQYARYYVSCSKCCDLYIMIRK